MLGSGFRRAAGLALGSGALLAAHSRLDDRRVPSSWPVRSAAACEAAASELPTFRRDDVAKHAGGDAGVWVMLGSRVFDITHFIENHPGGMDKIMMAAGKSLEPFWALYRQHVERAGEDGSIEAKEHVEQLLQEYQIGWLHPDDVKEAAACARAADDPYANQPARHPALKVLSEIPCSAELPASLMMDSWLTPAPLWYVRHHHPVPDLDADSFRLRVHGLGVQDREYSLAQLQALAQKAEVAVTVQCGGNRRGEYNDVRKTSGRPAPPSSPPFLPPHLKLPAPSSAPRACRQRVGHGRNLKRALRRRAALGRAPRRGGQPAGRGGPCRRAARPL